MRRVAVPLAAVAATMLGGSLGCSDPGAEGPPSFEIGTGEDSFEALEDGDELAITAGAQGGYHLWLGGRFRGLEGEIVAEFGLRDAGTGESLSYFGQKQHVHPDDEDGWGEFAGLTDRFRLDDPGPYVGHEVVVWARLVDETGARLEDNVTVRVASAR